MVGLSKLKLNCLAKSKGQHNFFFHSLSIRASIPKNCSNKNDSEKLNFGQNDKILSLFSCANMKLLTQLDMLSRYLKSLIFPD